MTRQFGSLVQVLREDVEDEVLDPSAEDFDGAVEAEVDDFGGEDSTPQPVDKVTVLTSSSLCDKGFYMAVPLPDDDVAKQVKEEGAWYANALAVALNQFLVDNGYADVTTQALESEDDSTLRVSVLWAGGQESEPDAVLALMQEFISGLHDHPVLSIIGQTDPEPQVHGAEYQVEIEFPEPIDDAAVAKYMDRLAQALGAWDEKNGVEDQNLALRYVNHGEYTLVVAVDSPMEIPEDVFVDQVPEDQKKDETVGEEETQEAEDEVESDTEEDAADQEAEAGVDGEAEDAEKEEDEDEEKKKKTESRHPLKEGYRDVLEQILRRVAHDVVYDAASTYQQRGGGAAAGGLPARYYLYMKPATATEYGDLQFFRGWGDEPDPRLEGWDLVTGESLIIDYHGSLGEEVVRKWLEDKAQVRRLPLIAQNAEKEEDEDEEKKKKTESRQPVKEMATGTAVLMAEIRKMFQAILAKLPDRCKIDAEIGQYRGQGDLYLSGVGNDSADIDFKWTISSGVATQKVRPDWGDEQPIVFCLGFIDSPQVKATVKEEWNIPFDKDMLDYADPIAQWIMAFAGLKPNTESKKRTNEGRKRFNTQTGIGKSKHVLNFHDGVKTHKDGSDFYDIRIFSNAKDLAAFVADLKSKGYVEESIESKKPASKARQHHLVQEKTMALTPETAKAAAWDAGNASMRKAGRTSWNEEDMMAADQEMARLMRKVEPDNPTWWTDEERNAGVATESRSRLRESMFDYSPDPIHFSEDMPYLDNVLEMWNGAPEENGDLEWSGPYRDFLTMNDDSTDGIPPESCYMKPGEERVVGGGAYATFTLKLSKNQWEEGKRGSRKRPFRESTEPEGSKYITVSYDTVTPESAEEGDVAESGWEDEEGVDMTPDEIDVEDGISAVDKAVDYLQKNGPMEPSSSQFTPHTWYTHYEGQDPSDGSETSYSYHLNGFTPEEEQEIYRRMTSKNESRLRDFKSVAGCSYVESGQAIPRREFDLGGVERFGKYVSIVKDGPAYLVKRHPDHPAGRAIAGVSSLTRARAVAKRLERGDTVGDIEKDLKQGFISEGQWSGQAIPRREFDLGGVERFGKYVSIVKDGPAYLVKRHPDHPAGRAIAGVSSLTRARAVAKRLERGDTVGDIEKDLKQGFISEGQWSGKVDTDWTPPEGFFNQSAEKIARGLESASTGLQQAMSRLNFYINRAGENLSDDDKKRLEKAKDELHHLYDQRESVQKESIVQTDTSEELRKVTLACEASGLKYAVTGKQVVISGTHAQVEESLKAAGVDVVCDEAKKGPRPQKPKDPSRRPKGRGKPREIHVPKPRPRPEVDESIQVKPFKADYFIDLLSTDVDELTKASSILRRKGLKVGRPQRAVDSWFVTVSGVAATSGAEARQYIASLLNLSRLAVTMSESHSSEPESIAASLDQATQETIEHARRCVAIMNQLPEGTTIHSGRKTWTKTTVAGDIFWTDGKRWVSNVVMEVGAKIASQITGIDMFNPPPVGTVLSVGKHQTTERVDSESSEQPIRYDPNTNRHNGQKLVRGDLIRDTEGKVYILDRDRGYFLNLDVAVQNPEGMWRPSSQGKTFSVDPTNKDEYHGDLFLMGKNVFESKSVVVEQAPPEDSETMTVSIPTEKLVDSLLPVPRGFFRMGTGFEHEDGEGSIDGTSALGLQLEMYPDWILSSAEVTPENTTLTLYKQGVLDYMQDSGQWAADATLDFASEELNDQDAIVAFLRNTLHEELVQRVDLFDFYTPSPSDDMSELDDEEMNDGDAE